MPKKKTDKIDDLPRIHANPEYEQLLLGHLLDGHPDSEDVLDRLPPEVFFIPSNRKIYQAILSLYDDRKPIGTMAVWETLQQKDEPVEISYLISLTGNTLKERLLEVFTSQLKRLYRIRGFQDFVQLLGGMLEQQNMTEEKFLEAASLHIAKLETESDLDVDTGTTYLKAGQDLICSLDKKVEKRYRTGIAEIDKLTGGIHPGELVVLTADTGVGKTLLAQQIRRLACADNKHTLYCSGEMMAHHLVGREVASEAHVPHSKLRNVQTITNDERMALLEVVGHSCKQCRVLDNELTFNRIKRAAKILKKKNELDLLILDYDELIESPGKDEWEQQKNLVRGSKSLAMQLDIALVLISQLRKPLTGEDQKKPRLQSLYGSGSKAKHASLVLYVDREYVRDLEGDETKATIWVLKSRDGRVGFSNCLFNIRTLQFEDSNGPIEITPRRLL